jgi:hypothetical protein
MTKCLRCVKFIPEYSIEWSDTPDDQKCRCAKPSLPAPPIKKLFDWLFNAKEVG